MNDNLFNQIKSYYCHWKLEKVIDLVDEKSEPDSKNILLKLFSIEGMFVQNEQYYQDFFKTLLNWRENSHFNTHSEYWNFIKLYFYCAYKKDDKFTKYFSDVKYNGFFTDFSEKTDCSKQLDIIIPKTNMDHSLQLYILLRIIWEQKNPLPDEIITEIEQTDNSDILIGLVLKFLAFKISEDNRKDKAIIYFLKAIEVNEKLKSYYQLIFAYRGISNVFFQRGKLKEVTKFIDKANKVMEILEKDENYSKYQIDRQKNFNYQIVIRMYRAKGLLKNAKEIINKTLELKHYSSPIQTVQIKLELARIQGDLGNFKEMTKLLDEIEEKFNIYIATLWERAYYSLINEQFDVDHIRKQLETITNNAIYDEEQNTYFYRGQKYSKVDFSIIEATIYQGEEKWVEAIEKYKESIEVLLDVIGYIKAYELITTCYFHKWMAKKSEKNYQDLKDHLNQWEERTREQRLVPYLCKVLLLKSKLFSADFNMRGSKECLEEVIEIATKSDLPLHLEFAKKQLETIEKQQTQVLSISEVLKEQLKEVQLKEFQNYVNKLGKLLQETSDDKELEEKIKEMK